MASRGNPNVPQKAKKYQNHRRAAKKNNISKPIRGKFSKAKASTDPNGANSMPLGGVNASEVMIEKRVSSKKAKKLDKAKNFARQRQVEKAMEAEGEVKMTDAPKQTPKQKSKSTEVVGDTMEID